MTFAYILSNVWRSLFQFVIFFFEIFILQQKLGTWLTHANFRRKGKRKKRKSVKETKQKYDI